MGGDGKEITSDRTIGFFKLVAISFASVAGGPYGFEDSVRAGGPFYTIVGLCIIPFVWAIPCAYMTAELATMIPENGGHVVWVDMAWGRGISFLNSYTTLFCCLFEGGVYPVLFLDYTAHLFGGDFSAMVRLFMAFVLIGGTAYINILGVDAVGEASVVITVLGISPFLLMIMFGFPAADEVFEVMHDFDKEVDFGMFLTILMWNTSGYDSLGAIAGEVENPSTTFPRALWASMALTISLDMLVMITGVVAVPDASEWADGTFYQVAMVVGGRWLAYIFMIGASVSMIGLYNTLLCTCSHIMYGMGQIGTLPECFTWLHPTRRTPYVAIGVLACSSYVMTLMPFTALAESEMWFYGLSSVFKFTALCRLRYKMPDYPRPYKIPVGDVGLMLFCVAPICMCFLTIATSSVQTHCFGITGVGVAALAFYGYTVRNPGWRTLERKPLASSVDSKDEL